MTKNAQKTTVIICLLLVATLIPSLQAASLYRFYSEAELILYAGRGDLDNVKYYLERGANINAQSGDKSTALHASVLSGHLEVVKYLVENGANIHDKNEEGDTALDLAHKTGDKEIVAYLLQEVDKCSTS